MLCSVVVRVSVRHLAPRMASGKRVLRETFDVAASDPWERIGRYHCRNGNGPIKIRNRAATAKLSTSLTSAGIRDHRRPTVGEHAMFSLIDAPLISDRSVPINLNSRWISRELGSWNEFYE